MLLRNRSQAAAAPGSASPREAWLKELTEIRGQLDNNERLFNMTSDFDVTDYTIHERNALHTRYRFLLRQIKDYDATVAGPEEQPRAAVNT